MNSRKKLKQEFIFETGASLVFAILFIVGVILIIVNRNQILVLKKWLGIVILSILVLLCSVASLGFLFDFIKHCKDFKAIKNGNLEEVTGTVCGFVKNQDPDSGQQINCMPIIRISGSNELIKLKINSFLKVGETYDFIYLKYSKIGAVNDKS